MNFPVLCAKTLERLLVRPIKSADMTSSSEEELQVHEEKNTTNIYITNIYDLNNFNNI